MSEVKNEGLEVVAWISADGTHAEASTKSTVYGSHTIPLCRHSKALAAIAARDARIVELDHRCGMYGLELTNEVERRIQATEKSKELRAELAVMTQHADNYSKMFEDAAEELAAIRAQEPVAYIPVDRGTGDKWPPVYVRGSGKICDYTPLYAAPVAKQVVMPERTDEKAAPVAKPDGYLYELKPEIYYCNTYGKAGVLSWHGGVMVVNGVVMDRMSVALVPCSALFMFCPSKSLNGVVPHAVFGLAGLEVSGIIPNHEPLIFRSLNAADQEGGQDE